ncbi:hypothetical protein P4U97_01270 [Bacillus swezeyi]|uniref:hypothetical protein n=1 Tax=Bacillus swezeyi TaxID=1925020 RepID=UPI002E1E0977|nr:hypothetical protein [Bacillus swezeyi]
MRDDNLFLTVNWYKDDIFQVFENKGIPLTQANFSKLKELGGASSLRDRIIQETWEMLDIIVDMNDDQFVYDEESFVIIEHEDRPYVLTCRQLNNYCAEELNCQVCEFLQDYTWEDSQSLINYLNLDNRMCKAYLSETAFEYVTWIYYDGNDSDDLLERKAKFLFDWLNIEVDLGLLSLEDI